MAKGDKKPVVMTGDIDSTVAKKLHAAQHKAGGVDPITAADVGAVPNDAIYIGDVDLLDYVATLKKSVTLHCNNRVTNTPYTDHWLVEVEYASKGEWYTLTATNVTSKERCVAVLNNGIWSGWTSPFATTDYAVNKAGDKMTGTLNFRGDGKFLFQAANATNEFYTNALIDPIGEFWLGTQNNDVSSAAALVLNPTSRKMFFAPWDGISQPHLEVLHTGNKNLITPADIGAATMTEVNNAITTAITGALSASY
jgi:hypothetical protein